jgi:hypothetical protein
MVNLDYSSNAGLHVTVNLRAWIRFCLTGPFRVRVQGTLWRFFVKSLALGTATVVALAPMCISSPASAAIGVSATTPLQNGYAKNETFCNRHGTVTYRVMKKVVVITVDLHSLTPKKHYSLDWQNNNVRGYTIGAFKTTSTGAVATGSLRLFRDAELHGIGVLVYYLSGVNPKAILHFRPC